MLPAKRRLPEVRRLVDQQGYFVLHAPRQVGKTTALLSLEGELTTEGRYVAVLVSMIAGADMPASTLEEIGTVERALLGSWRQLAKDRLPLDLQPSPWPDAPPVVDSLTRRNFTQDEVAEFYQQHTDDAARQSTYRLRGLISTTGRMRWAISL